MQMEGKWIIGVDPGLGGAIAYIEVIGEADFALRGVKDMPILPSPFRKGNDIDLDSLVPLLEPFRCCESVTGFIELVNPMPNEGVSAVFKFGRGSMAPEAMMAAFNIPRAFIRPNDWKKEMGLLKKDKAASVALVRTMFPQQAEWFTASKDGRAEAVLIGIAGYKISRR